MEIKVKSLDSHESKSVQEIEAQLLEKHENQFNEEGETSVVIETESNVDAEENSELEKSPLSDDDVLSYIKNKSGKDLTSLDDLFKTEIVKEELPEDVEAYYNYKKETGRGLDDYVKLQKDFDSMNTESLLREYFLATEDGLDEDDIEDLLLEYSYDEDIDDESTIKKINLAKKKTVVKAKKFFNEQKEMYKQPLESRKDVVSEVQSEQLKAYNEYIESAKTIEEESSRKRDWFSKKTNEVFSNDFKGFEFILGDKKVNYTPGDVNELKKAQESPMNFIGKFLDENGLINDAVGYHKSLAVAMNPEKFAKFFYEQGKSEATEDVIRKTKNINMSERRAPESVNKGGVQVRAVNPSNGNGLKIKSIKRN